jgi:hypothetical protein
MIGPPTGLRIASTDRLRYRIAIAPVRPRASSAIDPGRPQMQRLQWLDHFCSWLEQTALSQMIQTTRWIIPTVQSIHILSISLLIASALMIDLRLLGFVGLDQSLKRVSARFLPFIWWTLPVLLATGSIMIIGEPVRSLENPVFALKMCLLVGAIVVTGVYQLRLRNDAVFTGPGAVSRAAVWPVAILSLLLWVGIIFAGRWIAYF